MTTEVSYNGNIIRPAPFLSIEHSPNMDKEGQILSSSYTITLNGDILPNVGSPNVDAVFGGGDPEDCVAVDESGLLPALLNKYCSIQDLFSENYQELSIGNLEDDRDNIVCYPTMTSFSLQDGKHAENSKYTVVLAADNIFCGDTPLSDPSGCVESYTESWSMDLDTSTQTSQYGDTRVFNLQHSVSAVGMVRTSSSGVESTAIECARDFVCAKLGFENNQIAQSCIENLPTFEKGYNHARSESVDEQGGTYSVTESWTLTSGTAFEDFSVEKQISIDSSFDTVSVQGTVIGLDCQVSGLLASGDDKYSHAVEKFAEVQPLIYSRASLLTGSNDLNTDPLSYSIGRNTIAGTINYNYTFNNRLSKRIASARSESISVSNNWEEDMIVTTRIWGRGEALQRTNNGTNGFRAHRTTLNMDLVYASSGDATVLTSPRFSAGRAAEIQAVVDTYNPQLLLGVPAYIDSQSENWNPHNGTYNYAITWLWQPSGVC